MLKYNLLKIGGGKSALVLAVLLLGCSTMYAADLSAGTYAIGSTTGGVARYVPVAQKLAYVLAAVIALASAVIIYKKLQEGSENAKKLIAVSALSCVFLTASASTLPKFFGLNPNRASGVSLKVEVQSWEAAPGDKKQFQTDEGEWRDYIVADDEEKVWRASSYRGEGISGIGWNKEINNYSVYRLTPQGDTVWSTRLNVTPNKMDFNPKTGRYTGYVIANDGTKVWLNDYLTPKATDRAPIGVTPDGKYKPYLVADDGTKVWGDELFPDRINNNVGWEVDPNVRWGLFNGNYHAYKLAEDGTKIWTYMFSAYWHGHSSATGVRSAKRDDGKYYYYVTADNGVKLWGQVVSDNKSGWQSIIN